MRVHKSREFKIFISIQTELWGTNGPTAPSPFVHLFYPSFLTNDKSIEDGQCKKYRVQSDKLHCDHRLRIQL
jgi:hypothetical protein